MPRQTGVRERRNRQPTELSSAELTSDGPKGDDRRRTNSVSDAEKGISRPTTTDNVPADNENLPAAADRRWQREFDLRSQDALAGIHQPMLAELILRMPRLHNSLDADIKIFAERLLARLKVDGDHRATLIDRIQALLLSPTHDACFAAAVSLEYAWMQRSPGQAAYLADASGRCDYYAAAKNDRAGAFRTAGRALVYAHDDDLPRIAQLALVEAALGWLLRAGWDLPDVIEIFGFEQGGAGPPGRRSAELGCRALQRLRDLFQTEPTQSSSDGHLD